MTTAPSIVEWTTKTFDQLTVDELANVLQLRQSVFVVEQKCWYLDADGVDKSRCTSWAGFLLDSSLAICGSCRPVTSSTGRQLAASSDNGLRRHRIGTSLMTRGIELVEERYPTFGIALSAQNASNTFIEASGSPALVMSIWRMGFRTSTCIEQSRCAEQTSCRPHRRSKVPRQCGRAGRKGPPHGCGYRELVVVRAGSAMSVLVNVPSPSYEQTCTSPGIMCLPSRHAIPGGVPSPMTVPTGR